MNSTIESLALVRNREDAEQTINDLYPLIDQASFKHDGLLSGRTGLVIYYFYMYKQYKDEKFAEKAVVLLEEIVQNMANQKFTYSLASGLAGLGLALSLLIEEGIIDSSVEKSIKSYDKYIYTFSLNELKNSNTDYLYGPLGVLLHFATRYERDPSLGVYINTLVDQLYSLAIIDDKGLRFPNSLIAHFNDSQNINLGFAHGQCGILMTLLKIYEIGIATVKIKDIVNKGINYIVGLQVTPDFNEKIYSLFPLTIDDSKLVAVQTDQYGARLGWCYGDLNETLLFYKASHLLGNPKLNQLADEIGLATTYRQESYNTAINDGQFCHGSIGVAQTYKRIFEITSSTCYLESYRFWIDETNRYTQQEILKDELKSHAGELLTGAVGTSLGLLSAVNQQEAKWDRLFLLS